MLRLRAWTKHSCSGMGAFSCWSCGQVVLVVAKSGSSPPLIYRAVAAYGKVVTSAHAQIPLGSSLASKVRETSRRLADGLRAELNDPGILDPPSAWTLAQSTAASNGMIKINAEAVRAYFRNKEKIACNCWQEISDSHPPHVAVSGWVLFALAELNSPATEAQVRFFLTEQKRAGWWSAFQATDNETFASTFGTAWALIGLQTQLRNKLIPRTMEEDISNAIGKGSSWLINHRMKGPRWKDYPLNEKGEDSDSLSGLVMHALHLTASDSIIGLKKEWLGHLADKPPLHNSVSSVWVTPRMGDRFTDNSTQITLPWMLIATADAYAAGDNVERARALLWMERALDQDAVMQIDTHVQNWWRAEFLLALRYVAG